MTAYSAALAEPSIASTVQLVFDIKWPTFLNLPCYLASIDHQNPNDNEGPWKFFKGVGVWDFLKTNPEVYKNLGVVMNTAQANRGPWVDLFPTEQLIADSKPEDVLVVDIGGNIGHDMESFRHKHPDAPGRLVLQDTPEAIGQIKSLDPSIERVPHDFFKPQPVQGSRSRFFCPFSF